MVHYKAILCIVGAFTAHFSLGSIYTFGNMSPYMASYMKYHGQKIEMDQMVWIFAFAIAFQGLTMPFGGLLAEKIGSRLTTLLGCWIMSLSVMLTYFTIEHGFYLLILTYGILFGLGTGIAYSVAIAAAIKWFPHKKGLIIGIVVGGFGLGSLVFNQIQTTFINPNNLHTNLTIGRDKYFNDPQMLKHVPYSFLLTGGIYAILQLIGCLLLIEPTIWEDSENTLSYQNRESTLMGSDSTINTIKSEEPLYDPVVVTPDILKYTAPRDALKSRDFWLLWLIFLCNGTANIFVSSLYKAFGQKYINDDLYLATVGSISAIFNAGGRVLWGSLMDRTNFKLSMRLITTIATLFMATYFLESKLTIDSTGSKVMHIIWVCTLLGSICGSFSIIPSATAKIFGTSNVATIYGMVFSANAISGFVGAFTTSVAEYAIGYLGIFEIGAGLLIISFILTFLFKNKFV